MSDEAPRKRSRFDQTEAEPKKPSRFDRRSRSPVARDTDSSRRSRSPLAKSARSLSTDSKPKTPVDPAAAAAAAAARINAQIEARRGAQHVDVPPVQSPGSSENQPESTKPTKASSGTSIAKVDGDIYVADGDYIKDIEVNDLKNRYTLTKGSTQKMVNTPCHTADNAGSLHSSCARIPLRLFFSCIQLRWLVAAYHAYQSSTASPDHCIC